MGGLVHGLVLHEVSTHMQESGGPGGVEGAQEERRSSSGGGGPGVEEEVQEERGSRSRGGRPGVEEVQQ